MPKLKVQKARQADVYADIARIPGQHRLEQGGASIAEGSLCDVIVLNKKKRLFLRGWEETDEAVILMDEITRKALALENHQTYGFTFKEVGWLGQFFWGWSASAPGYRIAFRISVVSLVLGIVGLALGIIGIWRK